MKRLQTNTHKTLLGALTTLFVLLTGVDTVSACHQNPCPPFCEGKRCQ